MADTQTARVLPPRDRRRRALGWAVVVALVAAVAAVLLGGRGGFSLWNDAVIEDGGHVATGVVDIVSTGTPVYQVGAAAFDPATDRLIAGQTLTITVPTTVRVSGTSTDPSLAVEGLVLPAGLVGKATLTSAATGLSVSAADQAATITITLAADRAARLSGEVVDLSAVLARLTTGTSWQDTQALDLASITMLDLPELDITYDTTMSGATTSIKVPISGRTGSMLIDWGDETPLQTITTDNPTHVYASGEWTARVFGNFSHYGSSDSAVQASNKSVKSVDRWDGNGVTDLSHAFDSAENLTAVATPPAGLTNLTYAFYEARVFNQDLTDWDTSAVTDMSYTFYGAYAFNGAVDSWDTSQVTTMSNMFRYCYVFNQPIGGWDVSKVASMSRMFQDNYRFDQPLDSWITTNVTDMSYMFYAAISFNQPIGTWDTSKVTTMFTMFKTAFKFNQPIGTWNTSKVTNMSDMFNQANVMQADLSAWTVNLISSMPSGWSPPSFAESKWPLPWQHQMVITYDTTMPGATTNIMVPISGRTGSMLIDWGDGTPLQTITTDNPTHVYASGEWKARVVGYFTHYGSSDSAVLASNRSVKRVDRWDGNGVTSVRFGFNFATNLVSVAEPPHTVTDMSYLFEQATKFNQNIGGWNTSNVTNMEHMFSYAKLFNQNISSWNTSKVINMNTMFWHAEAFNQPIGGWNTTKVTNMANMFWDAHAFNQPLGGWNTANVTNMGNMFQAAHLFNQPLGTWDTAKVTNMAGMFQAAYLFNQPIGTWNTAKVASMTNMFLNANAMTADLHTWTVDLIPSMPANWKPSAGYPQAKWPLPWQGYTMLVTYDTGLAGASTTVTLPIVGRSGPVMVNWGDGTSAVMLTDDLPTHTYASAASRQVRIYGQFASYGSTDAGVLASNPGVKSVDQWDANGVTSVADAFLGASHLTAVVEPPHTVTNMSGMFEGASAFNQDISGWNTAAVTEMSRMFADAASFNQPLGTWNTTVVADMTGMFSGASAMTADLSAWTVDLIASMPANWKPTASFPMGKWPWPWQDAMVITYDTTMPSATTAIKVPISGVVGTVRIDWEGDGSAVTVVTGSLPTHTYSPGVHTAIIRGQFATYGSTDPAVKASNKSVQSVDRWDANGVTSVADAFSGASNLVSVVEPPHTVTNMSGMFQDATNFNQPIGDWDTSAVTNMQRMFAYARYFNQDLHLWNTANVTDMSKMFWWAEDFNQPIGSWTTDEVRDLSLMFSGAHAFNQPLGDWHTSNVTNLYGTFWDARVFNQPIGGWDTGAVTNMNSMFKWETAFNQPLGSWNTSEVTDMTEMFNGATGMAADLSAWTVDLIPSMPASWKPTAGYPMAKWPVPWQATILKLNVTSAGKVFTLPISDRSGTITVDWGDGSAVETISTDYPTHTYAVGTPTVTVNGHFGTYGEKIVLRWPEEGNVTDNLFRTLKTSNALITSVENWGGRITSMSLAFTGANNLSAVAAPPASVTDLSWAFHQNPGFTAPITGWDTSHVTTMRGMFNEASNFNQAIGGWNTSKVTDFYWLFRLAESFNQPVNDWDTSSVTNMGNVFNAAKVFNQPLDKWKTSNVTNMSAAFFNAHAFNQPLAEWKTPAVIDMSDMFRAAEHFNQDLASWDTSHVTNMVNMFYGANAMTADLHEWKVEKIATMPSGWSPPNYPQEKWPQRWQPVAPTGVMVQPAMAPTPSEPATFVPTPTPTPTPSESVTFGPTPTPTPSESVTFGPTPTPTPTPALAPTLIPTPTPRSEAELAPAASGGAED